VSDDRQGQPTLEQVIRPRRVILVTGLSGAGKSTILRVLEDLGFAAIDNPPLSTLEEIVTLSGGDLAIGVDARTTGFDPAALVAALSRLRTRPGLAARLVYATADEGVLLRRYTATRRRHPMALGGTVSEGIAAEQTVIAPLREVADELIDTSDLPPPDLRRLVEARFGGGHENPQGLTVALQSFAFPAGLPRDADMVFDARFLRNPFYDPTLSPGTGLDAAVAAYVRADPDYQPFLDRTSALLRLVLPRFVAEGKKYATIAVGCSGGRHRSVTLVEALARRLRRGDDEAGEAAAASGADLSEQQDGASPNGDWSIIVIHRELDRLGISMGSGSAGQDRSGTSPAASSGIAAGATARPVAGGQGASS